VRHRRPIFTKLRTDTHGSPPTKAGDGQRQTIKEPARAKHGCGAVGKSFLRCAAPQIGGRTAILATFRRQRRPSSARHAPRHDCALQRRGRRSSRLALPWRRWTSAPLSVCAAPHAVHCPAFIFDSNLEAAPEADQIGARAHMLGGHCSALARREQKGNACALDLPQKARQLLHRRIYAIIGMECARP